MSFPAGTNTIFAQNTAPTGWTKNTAAYNNHALRVVSGAASSGGSVDFTTVFSTRTWSGSVAKSPSFANTQAYTLASGEMGNHNHIMNNFVFPGPVSGVSGFAPPGTSGPLLSNSPSGNLTSGPAGGGGSHNHLVPAVSPPYSAGSTNMSVKYLDVIIATKD